MDNYVAGVAPREMPASWDRAALRAQAVAVRSYARYEVNHNPGNPWDVCDTSACQVYGGAAHYAADGMQLRGLAELTGIAITKRDGRGAWGAGS